MLSPASAGVPHRVHDGFAVHIRPAGPCRRRAPAPISPSGRARVPNRSPLPLPSPPRAKCVPSFGREKRLCPLPHLSFSLSPSLAPASVSALGTRPGCSPWVPPPPQGGRSGSAGGPAAGQVSLAEAVTGAHIAGRSDADAERGAPSKDAMGGVNIVGAAAAMGSSSGPRSQFIAPLAHTFSHRPLEFHGVPWASSEYCWVQLMYAEKVTLENALPLVLHSVCSNVVFLAVGTLPTPEERKTWHSSLGRHCTASSGPRFVARSSDATVDSGALGTRAREAFAMPDGTLRRPEPARVIATLSHGPIEATFEVNHVDGDCQSNAAYNLDVKPPNVHYKKTNEERTGMGQNLYAVSSSVDRTI